MEGEGYRFFVLSVSYSCQEVFFVGSGSRWSRFRKILRLPVTICRKLIMKCFTKVYVSEQPRSLVTQLGPVSQSLTGGGTGEGVSQKFPDPVQTFWTVDCKKEKF